jgi:hypothetical protein
MNVADLEAVLTEARVPSPYSCLTGMRHEALSLIVSLLCAFCVLPGDTMHNEGWCHALGVM